MTRFTISSLLTAAAIGLLALVGLLNTLVAQPRAAADVYDVVIANGRVIDPESGLDATRNIGISGGKIRMISESPLQGIQTIGAKGWSSLQDSLICTNMAGLAQLSVQGTRRSDDVS
jgi:hypothetical protein